MKINVLYFRQSLVQPIGLPGLNSVFHKRYDNMTVEQTITITNHPLQIEQKQLNVQVTKLTDSFYLNISDQLREFSELAVGMPSKFDKAIGTTVYTLIDSKSEQIAKRLALKFSVPFFVSCLEFDDLTAMQVESQLIGIIKDLI